MASISRRDFIKNLALLFFGVGNASLSRLVQSTDNKGYRFAFYADSLSFPRKDSNRAHHSENFLKISRQIAKLSPSLDFTIHVGDHIWGYTNDKEALKSQWREWREDFKILENQKTFHTTGNHTVYDEQSASIFKETFPSIPDNGPSDQKGLYYYIREKDLLLIFVNTAYQKDQKEGRVDYKWVDRVLTENSDAKHKLVFGHHPAHHVNGYMIEGWRIWDGYAVPFWNVLVRHKVNAYICAHIIAFDVQVHSGVLQITSAGGGFPFMFPAQTEYLHFSQAFMNEKRLEIQTIDQDGKTRERFVWPAVHRSVPWRKISSDAKELPVSDMFTPKKITPVRVFGFKFKATNFKPSENPQTLLAGFRYFSSGNYIFIGMEHDRLTVKVPVSGMDEPPHIWYGPQIDSGDISFQLFFNTEMGPGGVMMRSNDEKPFTSLKSDTSRGLIDGVWPDKWLVGHDHTGVNFPDHSVTIISKNKPFLGRNLTISFYSS